MIKMFNQYLLQPLQLRSIQDLCHFIDNDDELFFHGDSLLFPKGKSPPLYLLPLHAFSYSFIRSISALRIGIISVFHPVIFELQLLIC